MERTGLRLLLPTQLFKWRCTFLSGVRKGFLGITLIRTSLLAPQCILLSLTCLAKKLFYGSGRDKSEAYLLRLHFSISFGVILCIYSKAWKLQSNTQGEFKRLDAPIRKHYTFHMLMNRTERKRLQNLRVHTSTQWDLMTHETCITQQKEGERNWWIYIQKMSRNATVTQNLHSRLLWSNKCQFRFY